MFFCHAYNCFFASFSGEYARMSGNEVCSNKVYKNVWSPIFIVLILQRLDKSLQTDSNINLNRTVHSRLSFALLFVDSAHDSKVSLGIGPKTTKWSVFGIE